MPERPETPRNLLQERQLALREKMAGQHPFHEQMAMAYEEIGGLDALVEWAEDNPSQFFTLMMKAAPPPQAAPGKGGGGLNLTLNLHPSLAPGPLDVGPIDGEFTPLPDLS